MELRRFVRDIPDFPIEGILFRDITPLLQNAEALGATVDLLAKHYAEEAIDQVAAIESRGFIFGAPVACALGCGFVPIRKPGKLPAEIVSIEYTLEYGTNTLEMHKDAVKPGDRVLVIDDLLATGGSARAAVDLIEQCGAQVVGLAFAIELTALGGRAKLGGYPVYSLISY